MAADKIRPPPSRSASDWSLVNGLASTSRHSLATFLVSRGKDVKTVQEIMRHAKLTTTLDLYSQSIDTAKLEAQEDIALAIKSIAAAD